MSAATINPRSSVGEADVVSSAVRTDTVTTAPRTGWRISWGAIFAGTLIVLAVQMVLSLLGLGIGFSMVEPIQGGTPGAGNFGIGAGIWWVLTYLVALVAGGYVAARLAAATIPLDGMLQGLVTWAAALMVTVYLLSTAVGGVIGGAFNVVGGSLSGAGETLRNATPQLGNVTGLAANPVQDRARELLQQPTGAVSPALLGPAEAEREISTLLPQLALTGDRANQARDRITAIMASKLSISPEEAGTRLDATEAEIDRTRTQTENTARAAADDTTSGLSWASLLAFVALLGGALAAVFGGKLATNPFSRDHDTTHRRVVNH